MMLTCPSLPCALQLCITLPCPCTCTCMLLCCILLSIIGSLWWFHPVVVVPQYRRANRSFAEGYVIVLFWLSLLLMPHTHNYWHSPLTLTPHHHHHHHSHPVHAVSHQASHTLQNLICPTQLHASQTQSFMSTHLKIIVTSATINAEKVQSPY